MIRILYPLFPILVVVFAAKICITDSQFAGLAPLLFSFMYSLSLFYKCEKKCFSDLGLIKTVNILAEKMGVRSPSCTVYSSLTMNAYINGFGGSSAMYVSKGSQDRLSEGELLSVLAHELAHVKFNHPLMNAIAMHFVGIIYTFSLFNHLTWINLGVETLLIIVIFWAKTVWCELVADEYSSRFVDKSGLISFLKKVGNNSVYSRIRIWRLEHV